MPTMMELQQQIAQRDQRIIELTAELAQERRRNAELIASDVERKRTVTKRDAEGRIDDVVEVETRRTSELVELRAKYRRLEQTALKAAGVMRELEATCWRTLDQLRGWVSATTSAARDRGARTEADGARTR